MDFRRELFLAVGALMLINCMLALGAIGLFVRMGPAIEQILQENVESIVAAEEILAEVAAAGSESFDAQRTHRIGVALAKMRTNLTEKAEEPLVEVLERRVLLVAAGDAAARQEFLGAARELIAVNRDAMQAVDQEAQRLGQAGAWSAVFLGFLSFLLSFLVLVRLQHRVVRPILELLDVLESSRNGQRLRRCHIVQAPREVLLVTRAVNALLDERLGRPPLAAAPAPPAPPAAPPLLPPQT